MTMTLKEAKQITGHKSGLGKTSKMPGYSTSTSAKRCNVGSRLQKVPGSVCEFCYALRNNYMYPSVQEAHERRLQAIDNPLWVEAMVRLISHYTKADTPFFRWKDAGDIGSLEELIKIAEVAKRLPEIEFWLPTKEYRTVFRYLEKHGAFPNNLTVRLSAFMMGAKPPSIRSGNVKTSTVDWVGSDNDANSHQCPASTQNHECRDCRACWGDIPNINYVAQN